ncbi:MAG: SRPBCC domain-containing protein [Myxococcota bacterium]
MRDVVRVERCVNASIERSFVAFTEEIHRWWRPEPRFRWLVGGGTLRFTDGQLVEESGDERFIVGPVLAWEPSHHLAFGWRGPSFSGDESTRVDVRFVQDGPRTRVILEHSGWAQIRPDHPVRRGTKDTPAFRALLGLYWGESLGRLV